MCGRFNVESQPLSRFLMEMVGLPHPGPDNRNAAPTETVAVLRNGDSGAPAMVPMRWWLVPRWAKTADARYSMFNAKSETAPSSASFRAPMRERRCVVPVSGYYEWVRAAAGSRPGKLPYYVHPDAGGMLLAGIWDRWQPRDGGPALESFAILTTAAHPSLEFLHVRQPVMLTPAESRRWLDLTIDLDALLPLLAPRLPVAVGVDPVSTHVNDARNKDGRCVDPIGEPICLRASGATA